MRKSTIIKVLFAGLMSGLLGLSLVSAGDEAKADVVGKVQGKIFANWHMNLPAADDVEAIQPSSQFAYDRAYFGYKMTVNKKYTGRVMLDVGRASDDQRLIAYLKYGYLEMKNVIPVTTIKFGLHGLNQFSVQEKFWGYRYIYKSFMDANKFGTSADLGIGISIKPVDQFKFNINITNGEGYKKPQLDKLYKVAFGTEIHIIEGLVAYLYGDVMPYQADTKKRPQGTAAIFLGYKLKKVFRLGAEYNFQANQKGAVAADYNGLSVYTTVTAGIVDIFVRGDILSKDFLDVDEDEDKMTSATVIAGLSISPVKNLKIGPNFQLKLPEKGSDPKRSTIYVNAEFNF